MSVPGSLVHLNVHLEHLESTNERWWLPGLVSCKHANVSHIICEPYYLHCTGTMLHRWFTRKPAFAFKYYFYDRSQILALNRQLACMHGKLDISVHFFFIQSIFFWQWLDGIRNKEPEHQSTSNSFNDQTPHVTHHPTLELYISPVYHDIYGWRGPHEMVETRGLFLTQLKSLHLFYFATTYIHYPSAICA